MKNTIIKTALLTLAFSMPAFSADSHNSHTHGKDMLGGMKGDMNMPKVLQDHQGKMNQHMEKIHSMMSEMERNGTGKILLKNHMNAMSKGVRMLTDMQMDVIQKNKACLTAEESIPSDDITCFEEESHNDTEIRMMADLMSQMLKHIEMMKK